MKILALDLATTTGFAVGTVHGDGKPDLLKSGSWTIPCHARGEAPAIRFVRFEWWLRSMLTGHGFLTNDLIAYEQPHLRGGASAEFLTGLSVIVQKVAAERGLTYATCHTATLKLLCAGSGSADKADMIAAARRDWNLRHFPGSDEADALCLLTWATRGCPVTAARPKGKKKKVTA